MKNADTSLRVVASLATRKKAIFELVRTRKPVTAAEVFHEFIARGLELNGTTERNRTNSLIRSMLESGEIADGDIFFEDRGPGADKYELDPHIIQIISECAPIVPKDILSKLHEKGCLENVNVKQPTQLITRRLAILRKLGRIKDGDILNGTLSPERERLKRILHLG